MVVIIRYDEAYEKTLKFKVMNCMEFIKSWPFGLLTQQNPVHFRFHVLFAEIHHRLIHAKMEYFKDVQS